MVDQRVVEVDGKGHLESIGGKQRDLHVAVLEEDRLLDPIAAARGAQLLDARLLERLPRRLREIEDGLGGHLVGAAADHVRGAARPAEELQRVDEQGLAGAGFAGQNVQAGAGLDGELLDDGEVPHLQVRDHRGEV